MNVLDCTFKQSQQICFVLRLSVSVSMCTGKIVIRFGVFSKCLLAKYISLFNV